MPLSLFIIFPKLISNVATAPHLSCKNGRPPSGVFRSFHYCAPALLPFGFISRHTIDARFLSVICASIDDILMTRRFITRYDAKCRRPSLKYRRLFLHASLWSSAHASKPHFASTQKQILNFKRNALPRCRPSWRGRQTVVPIQCCCCHRA